MLCETQHDAAHVRLDWLAHGLQSALKDLKTMAANENFLAGIGFRFGSSGTHAARTIMLDDLRTLLAAVPSTATRADFADEVVSNNLLGKPTTKSRELALRHLTELYGLNDGQPLFRCLQRLWRVDVSAQPLLAFTAALARDPLLRSTQSFMLEKTLGSVVTRTEIESLLAEKYRDRFSPASLKSFAQNINGSWTSAGFLTGRSKKTRSNPIVTSVNVAFCLLLGHLEGLSGQRLFSSSWMSLLSSHSVDLEALASTAAHRGLLVFLNAGGVKEVRFPGYLTSTEEQSHQEASHVI